MSHAPAHNARRDMLRIHFSNRHETLAEALIDALAVPSASPFDADTVIVPSAAMRRALTLRIADRQGVCAHVGFDYLAQWLGRRLGTPRWSTEQIVWRIYAAFDDAAWAAQRPRLGASLAQVDAPLRLDLARRVATQFEQLMTYRPDWVEAWSDGVAADRGDVDAALRADAGWQAELWRRIVAGAGPPATRAALHAAVAASSVADWPRCLHVFALPAIAPAHLDLLAAIGLVAEVVIYAPNPCAEYWFEIVSPARLAALTAQGRALHQEVGNPMLAAWGRQTQAHLSALVQRSGDGVDDGVDFELPVGHTLLARVQQRILALEPMAPGSLPLQPDDRSIEVQVCHSLQRELEVLHDRLLDLFGRPDAPAPHEVLVVLPELEAAAPLIDAVFGTVPRERRIDYAITGRARSAVNTPARALLALLALLAGRAPVGEVAGLLAQPVVARRFGLDDDGVAVVQGWLADAGVHWGLDAEHRAALDLPAEPRVSLAEGVERLLLGHLLPAAAALPLHGVLPIGDVHGEHAEALGGLAAFAAALADTRHLLATSRPAAAWPVLIERAIDAFIAVGRDGLDDLAELRAAVQGLGADWAAAGLVPPLRLALVREALAERLDAPARGGVPQGAGTFSALASLRGLPYRVVCVLGLDGGVFPPSGRADEFDLIAAVPRAGDRQRRRDDRNLFLDLLLAARDVLHLSHTGHSVRDNSIQPASVVVDELLEWLVPAVAAEPQDAHARAAARARLVVHHPLQAFAESRFVPGGDPRCASFDAADAQAHRDRLARTASVAGMAVAVDADADVAGVDAGDATLPFIAAPLPPPEARLRRLSAERLAAFLRAPCKQLLRERLGVMLPWADEEPEDDEPLWPDGRARHALAARLLPALLDGADDAAAASIAAAGTAWPGGAPGAVLLAAELPLLRRHALAVQAARAGAWVAPVAIDLQFEHQDGPWTLHAVLADLRVGGLLFHRAGSLRAGDLLGAWVQHLLLCAAAPAGVELATTLIGRDTQAVFAPVADAPARLATLVALMADGLREPSAFLPRSAHALVAHGESRARSAWHGGDDDQRGERADPWLRLALRGRPDPLATDFERFAEAARAVFVPLTDALREGSL